MSNEPFAGNAGRRARGYFGWGESIVPNAFSDSK